MEDIFKTEQSHLSYVYKTLQDTLQSINESLDTNADTAKSFKKKSGQETALNFDSYADNLDTFAAIETMNKQIDYFNNKQTQLQNIKSNITRLLPAPYFAKMDLKYPDEEEISSFYIGSAGFSKTTENPMILDWRSPIADLYYNNKMGSTTYNANNRAINVTVKTRRQFLLHDDVLQNIFDSNLAIKDPLLLETLQKSKNNEMNSITATIQKEQNTIIRDTTSQALLVNGIAGSGKTSVVLQRIAYLLYHYRNQIISNNVLLLTPNSLFTSYINKVLPSLGEEAPLQMTFEQMLEPYIDEKIEFEDNSSHLSYISNNLSNLNIPEKSFRNIKLNGLSIFNKSTIKKIFDQTSKSITIDKRIDATTTVMIGIIEENIESNSRDGKFQSQLSELTDLQQERIFGHNITPNSDKTTQLATKKMLFYRNRKLISLIKHKKYLNIKSIIQLILNTDSLNHLDYAYTKLRLLNLTKKDLKFVMIDEIQDYSLDQIIFMIAAFPNVKWTLVGDEFQSIRESNTPLKFDDLKELFAQNNIKTTQKDLYTSYRSSGEITKAFVAHGSTELINRIKIIQTGGIKPQFLVNSGINELMEHLKAQMTSLNKDTLSAVITSDSDLATTIGQKFNIPIISNSDRLPQKGIVVLPLILAKGLEFDDVIIADAGSTYYLDKDLGENRLYTAFSRASRSLVVNETIF
ncbi:AAA family ATPase [Companilactobacillus allii]|uniref:UvrD-like helicase ATP-binding domain-containing protein n=1 Tax=Companilactobacillus allii TaxID=1847728 RepID=A0A1P8Q0U2_9LACO|nr:UvrD-helicase domain-containing protein [Companilactobacillus allii]APX71456.1 hypothetical protein BTM29_02300 [Companilactobacillus allii]USQ68536.1 AAA family ATPase [Companilactobacillus allii]